jgi:hypothetical protein
MNNSRPVTKDQIALAKQIDLLSYLQRWEPGSLKKSGVNEYCLTDDRYLKISNGKWNWFSQGIGGKTALDFLIHVRKVPFVDAVRTLLNDDGVSFSQPVRPLPKPITPQKSERKAFVLPKANNAGYKAIAYLQKRGIDNDIILRCRTEGLFYESTPNHNCVFVGKDTSGQARFATLRGTSGALFRRDVDGSDKRYGFNLPSSDRNSEAVIVTESAVDALSVASLRKLENADWLDSHYLSLGGANTVALTQFLSDRPQITAIRLCLDNDSTGVSAMEKIQAEYSGIYDVTVHVPPVDCGKDCNDLLMTKLAERSGTVQNRANKEIGG